MSHHCMIEFQCPAVGGASFQPSEADKSIGRPVISEATAAYLRHGAWRQAGKRPDQCPKPTTSDVIDAELDRLGITTRPERDRQWDRAVWYVMREAAVKHVLETGHRVTTQNVKYNLLKRRADLS